MKPNKTPTPSLNPITLVCLLVVSSIALATPTTIVVDNTPIKKIKSTTSIQLTILEDIKLSVKSLIAANNTFSKATSGEKDRLIACGEKVICQLDHLKDSAQAREAHATILEQLSQQLLVIEKNNVKQWIDSIDISIETHRKKYNDRRNKMVVERKKVAPVIQAAVSSGKDNIEGFLKKLTSDQQTDLRIFGSDIALQTTLLQQGKNNITSLKESKKMVLDKRDWLHSFANNLKFQANQLHNESRMQDSTSESIQIGYLSSVSQHEMDTLFATLGAHEFENIESYIPNSGEGYRYQPTLSPSLPISTGGLEFFNNGMLERLDQLLNWESK